MPNDKKDLINLDDIVEEWALDRFRKFATKKQAKIPKEALHMEINWKLVNFTHSEPDYKDAQKVAKPMSKVLFKTHFTNDTDNEQNYSFKMERTTRSTCHVEFEEGYTVGHEVSISLKLPQEVVTANAGFHEELEITKAGGETKEEEMTWAVDSPIQVSPNKLVIAEHVISEEQFNAQFVINTTIKGRVQVIFTNLNDNNSFVTSIYGKIADICKKHKNVFTAKDEGSVTTQFKGQCKFRYAIEQHIKLTQSDLNDKK
ncbi:uncharacterized protein LOC135488649 [Lineus longissimus]|uniref:uncharacterized protein LOC135488649 n=1 Tax=Lineus longissimus TaxID=88925 RepID=UPI00315DC3DD